MSKETIADYLTIKPSEDSFGYEPKDILYRWLNRAEELLEVAPPDSTPEYQAILCLAYRFKRIPKSVLADDGVFYDPEGDRKTIEGLLELAKSLTDEQVKEALSGVNPLDTESSLLYWEDAYLAQFKGEYPVEGKFGVEDIWNEFETVLAIYYEALKRRIIEADSDDITDLELLTIRVLRFPPYQDELGDYFSGLSRLMSANLMNEDYEMALLNLELEWAMQTVAIDQLREGIVPKEEYDGRLIPQLFSKRHRGETAEEIKLKDLEYFKALGDFSKMVLKMGAEARGK